MRWIALFLGVALNTAAHILLKGAAKGTEGKLGIGGFSDKIFQPKWVAGVLCFGVSVMFYTYVLSKFDLGVAQPIMTSLSILLTFVLAMAVFGESFTLYKGLGASLIVAGVIFMSVAS